MSKFLKGFIFGSVIGGAVALLNNPRSGKENREILAKQIQEVTQDVTVINTGKSLGIILSKIFWIETTCSSPELTVVAY